MYFSEFLGQFLKLGIPVFFLYKIKNWPKNSGRIHKNREKNLQFFGLNDLKIRWMVLEIKFIKGKTLKLGIPVFR